MDKKRIEEVLKTKTLADISEKYNDVYIKNKEQKEQKKIWVCFSHGYKYDLVSKELTLITPKDNTNNILNICSYFETIPQKQVMLPIKKDWLNMKEINNRKAFIDSIYSLLKTRNQKLALQDLKRLLIQHLEQLNAEENWTLHG